MTGAPDWWEDERLEAFRIMSEAVDDLADTIRNTHTIELIDWSTIGDTDDAIVEGLLLPGRWTAIAAPAKAGKSELALNVSIHVSEGRDPFDRNTVPAATVLYLDCEMGRLDLHERIVNTGHEPQHLARFHATDIVPRLDTEPGAAALHAIVGQLGVDVVVIDGINGSVSGAENDDTTWRAFYGHAIAPLKRRGVAVLTADNMGKDATLGPRGSSVKLDKADATVKLTRTDNGLKLTTTHRRTAAYPADWSLSVVGLDGTENVAYRRTASTWPAGTADLVEQLDRLGVPVDHGRPKVREALKNADIGARDTTIAAAIRYRRNQREQVREQVEPAAPEHLAGTGAPK